MKTRKIKGLIASLFALAMAVSVATTMAVTRQQKLPEIVLAEDVEDPETPVSNEDEASAQPADNSAASEACHPRCQNQMLPHNPPMRRMPARVPPDR